MNKKIVKLLFVWLFFTGSCFAANGNGQASAPKIMPVNCIAAIVNSQVITSLELEKQFKFYKAQLSSEKQQLPSDQILTAQVLQHLITNAVQGQLAVANHLTVSDEQFNASIEKMASSKQITVEQLYQQMKQFGLSKEDYQAQVREELVNNELMQRAVASQIYISDADVLQYKQSAVIKANANTEYLVGDILIATPQAASAEQIETARKRAQSVVDKINAGASFSEVAVSESDSQDALKDNNLGWRKYGALPSIFSAKVATMKAGEVAGPISAPNGFHIIKLEQKRVLDNNTALSDDQIKQVIFKRRFYEAMTAWLASQTDQAYVRINEECLNTLG